MIKYLHTNFTCEKQKEGYVMQYTVLQIRPEEAEKKINALAAQGWKVVSSSESKWEIRKCFGLSNTVDSVINVILVKE